VIEEKDSMITYL